MGEIFSTVAGYLREHALIDFASLHVITADPRLMRAVDTLPPLTDRPPRGSLERSADMGLDLVTSQPDGMEYIPRKVNLPSTRALTQAGYQRAWVTPLIADGVGYGMMTVARLAHGAFEPAVLELLRAVAALLATSVRQDLELERARRNAARANAASELIVALQGGEPIEVIFGRLPALLEECLEIDYIGLVLDLGEGFVMAAEAPETVHMGQPATPETQALVADLAGRGDFQQFRPAPDAPFTEGLHAAGCTRGAIALLRDGDELRGILVLARREQRHFDNDERLFIELLRSILAQSLANRTRFDRTAAAAARARTLNEVALLLNAGGDIETIFQKLLELIDKAIEVDYVGLMAINDDLESFYQIGSRPEIVRPAGTMVTAAEAGIDQMLEHDLYFWQYPLDEYAGRSAFTARMTEAGMRRAVSVIIRQGGQIEGVLSLARANEQPFTHDEEDFLETLSAMLGQAIGNRRRLRNAQLDAARQGLLNELAMLLNQGEAPAAFFASLSAQFQRVVPFDGLVLAVATARPDVFQVVGSARGKTFKPRQIIRREDFGEHILGLHARGVLVVEGDTLDLGGQVALSSREGGILRGAVAEIRHNNASVGYFLIGRVTNRRFSDAECAFVEIICAMVGQAIANRAKVEEKEAEAIRSQVLSELAVLLQGGERIDHHFEHLSAILLQAVGFDFISVTTLDPATHEYHSIRSHELFPPGTREDFHGVGMRLIREGNGASIQYRTAGNERPVPKALAAAGFERAISALVVGPDGVEGLLTIGRRESLRFSDQDTAFIELVAALLGQAAANYRKAYAREAEALRSRILSELALLVNNGDPIAAHFEHLRTLLDRGVGFDYLSIAVRDASGGFRMMRSEPLPGEGANMLSEGSRAAVENLTRQGVFSRQYGEDRVGHGAPSNLFEIGLKRCASFVLTHGSGTEGLLTIGRRSPAEFTAEEMAYFEVVATLLAYAAANERRLAERTQEAEDQAITAEAAAAVARETTILGIVRGLRAALGTFIPRPFVNFGYLDEGAVIRFPSRTGILARMEIDRFFGAAIEGGQVIVPPTTARIAAGETDLDTVAELGLECHIITRARSGGAVVGILVVGSRDLDWAPGEREARICRLIADIVAPAMNNARAMERERQEAEEQRVIAEVAAAAAREAEPSELVLSLHRPLTSLVPAPIIAFGYLDGDEILYPRPDGSMGRYPLDAYGRMTAEMGQIFGAELPLELPTDSDLRVLGVRAISSTAVLSGGQTVGFLLIGSRQEGFEFGRRELRVFRLIAQIVGPAMENARAALRARLDADEQRILAEAAAGLASGANEAEIVDSLPRPIRRFLPGAVVGVFSREGDSLMGVSTSTAGRYGPFAAEAISSGQTVAVRPFEGVSAEGMKPLDAAGIQKFINTSMNAGGTNMGMLFVGLRDATAPVGERELRLLRLIADMAGPALANARESARRQLEAHEQRILADAAAAVARGASEMEIIAALAAPIGRFIDGAHVSFSYVEGDEMWMADGSHRRPVHTLARQTLETGQVVGSVEDPRLTEASRELIRSAGIHEWASTTASSGGTPVGLLFVGSTRAGHEFSERELRLLRLIADITGPAMMNARDNARRSAEAEDERILASIAAVAARAESVREIMDVLPGALEPVVPGAVALHGFIDGDVVTYLVVHPEHQALMGTEMRLALTEVGRAARDSGQGVGSLASIPRDRPYWQLGLQAYSLTSYQVANQPMGVLMISTTDPAYQFTERALALLRRVVQVVGPAVESVRAEGERRRQAELYGLMLQSLSEGVILGDAEGHPVFANALGARLLDELAPDIQGRDWRAIAALLPDDLRRGYSAVFERGEGSRGRSLVDLEGRRVWIDYEFVPLDDPVMKLLFVAADVTADVEREAEQAAHRQQMEQAQRLAALGELIGGVAHELNNPLTAILGFAEVMSLSPDNHGVAEELAIIQKEALRARNIVRDLLFIARPGTSERSLVSVAELVAHIERLRKTAWNQQGIRWEIAIEEPCLAWGNEHQLTQVILNLVTNAEHALAGRLEKRISVRASMSGGQAAISVTDTGIGMDEQTRRRVFEPFFTTKQGIGTGLGLPLSYSIIQSHHGEIRVDSEPGRGTTFTVILPAAPEAEVPGNEPPSEVSAGRVRVLVVDDEPSLRKVCQRLISSMGHECATAESANSAIELARATDFDVVLCDYRLATETAGDVIAGFERVAPQLVARTIIATGATTDAGVVALTERYNLQLIAKPYGAEELAGLIQAASA